MNRTPFGLCFSSYKNCLGTLLVLLVQPLLFGQPDNDHFRNRTPLTGTNESVEGTFFQSTRESLDPGGLQQGSIWWSWVAPVSGYVQISCLPGQGSGLQQVILFRGNSPETLAWLSSSEFDSVKASIPPIVFRADSGENYSIVALGGIQSIGVFTLRLIVLPVNDIEPTVLSGESFDLAGTTVEATPERNFRHYPEIPEDDPAVSWEWTAPASGRVWYTVLPGSAQYLQHGVYLFLTDGSGPRWSGYTVKETIQGGKTFAVKAGDRFRFYFYSNPLRVGDFRWQMTFSRMQLVIRSDVSPLPGHVFTELLATNLPQITTQALVLAQDGMPFQTNAPSDSLFSWKPTSGGLHEIAVYMLDELGRPWLYLTNVTVRPPNDDLANAFELPPHATPDDFVRFSYATIEPGEDPGPPSIWYRWNAPPGVGGRIDLTSSFNSPQVMCEVFRGETFGFLEPIPSITQTNVQYAQTILFPSGSGGPILVALRSTNTPAGLRLAFASGPVPANDNYANQLLLEGTNLDVQAELIMATREQGENRIDSFANGRTIWYSWTSPADGELILTASSTNNQVIPTVGLFTDRNVSAPSVNRERSELRAIVQKGVRYAIGLDCIGPTDGQLPVGLDLTFTAAPGNDTQPEVLSGNTIDFRGTLAGATGVQRRNVFYEWTAPVSGLASFTLLQGTFPRIEISVWEAQGYYEKLTNFSRFALFMAERNRRYLFEIFQSALTPGADFSGRLTVETAVNDHFANRVQIDAIRTNFLFSSLGATVEPGEPAVLTNTVWWTWTAPTNGWLWLRTLSEVQVGVFTGNALAELAQVPTEIFSYKETTSSSSQLMIGFETIPGATYQIAVSQTNQVGRTYPFFLDFTSLRFDSPTNHAALTEGPLVLQLASPKEEIDGTLNQAIIVRRSLLPASPMSVSSNALAAFIITNNSSGQQAVFAFSTNSSGERRISAPLHLIVRPRDDSFSNATDLNSIPPATLIAFEEATTEPGEPPLAPGSQTGSIWWKWTAPASGVAEFEVSYSNDTNEIAIEIFTGTSLPTLQSVPFDQQTSGDSKLHRFAITRNNAYYIRLSNPSPYARFRRFEWKPVRILGLTSGQTLVAGRDHIEVAVDVPHDEIESVALVADGLLVGTAFAAPFLVPVTPQPGYYTALALAAIVHLKNGQSVRSFDSAGPILWRAANDDFSHRLPLFGTNLRLQSSFLSNATREPDEPSHGAPQLQRTLWWTWTAPLDGVLKIGQPQTSAIYAVYTGENLAALTLVESGPGSFRIPVKAGVSYQMALASDADYRTLPAAFAPLVESTTDLLRFPKGKATVQFGTLAPSGELQVRDFLWTAPANGILVVTIESSGSQPSLFNGDKLLSLAGTSNDFDPVLAWGVQKDQSYIFRFDAGTDDVSSFPWTFELHPSVSNDHFADAYPLPATVLNFPSLNTGSFEFGEPSYPSDILASGSMWFKWTAPDSKTMMLSIRGSWFTHSLVYTGSSLDSLQLVARDGAFWAETGTTYYIAVISFQVPNFGENFLTLQPLDPDVPSNDNLANATPLLGTSITFHASNHGAAREFREPAHGTNYSGRTVWWKWTALASGQTELGVAPAAFSTAQVAVYCGDSVTNLIRITSGEFSERPGSLLFQAEKDRDYLIAFSGPWAAQVEADVFLRSQDPSLEFESIRREGDQIVLELRGPPAADFYLESSADLKTWTSMLSRTFSIQGSAEISLPNDARQFFRLRLQ